MRRKRYVTYDTDGVPLVVDEELYLILGTPEGRAILAAEVQQEIDREIIERLRKVDFLR